MKNDKGTNGKYDANVERSRSKLKTSDRAASQLPQDSYLFHALKSSGYRNNRSRSSSHIGTNSDTNDYTTSEVSDSDWNSLGSEPSNPDSYDSNQTRKRKKRVRKRWRVKLLKLKLEQANGKPDPPCIYNG